jgi:hypothetical protein
MGAFTGSNAYITGNKPMPTPSGGEVVACRMTLPMATGDLNTGDIGPIGWLPAGCVPVDVLVDGTDMDTGAAALVLNVGILNAAGDDLSTAAADGGGAWGATTAANAAFQQRLTPTGINMVSVQATQSDRKLAVKVATGATTPAAGTLGLTLLYRAA